MVNSTNKKLQKEKKQKSLKKEKTIQNKNTKEKVVKACKKKENVLKKNDLSTCRLTVSDRPPLLLQYLYFLSTNATKHLSLGLAPDQDFRPLIVLTSGYSHVVFYIPDWITLFYAQLKDPIDKWFEGDDSAKDEIITMKNYKITKLVVNDVRLIEIENTPHTRVNNSVFLNHDEYKQCWTMDSYFQPLIKQMQTNSHLVRDYYELYVGYCYCKKKFHLDDEEFFVPFDGIVNVDTYRVFKEIPIICREKMKSDLSLMDEFILN